MKREYLGDSYDFVKRALVDVLRPLGTWATHPMLTEPVDTMFVASYSALLRVPVVSSALLAADTDRQSYFASTGDYEHLLLDPNTGLAIRQNQSDRSPDHLYDSDLVYLSGLRPRSLYMVFDQSLDRRQVPADILKEKCRVLREAGLPAFAYLSHACFIFTSRLADTVRQAHDLLSAAAPLPPNRLV